MTQNPPAKTPSFSAVLPPPPRLNTREEVEAYNEREDKRITAEMVAQGLIPNPAAR